MLSGVTGHTPTRTFVRSWKLAARNSERFIFSMRMETRMRFTTIWSLPGLPLKERIDRTLDLWSLNLADFLPRRVAYWVAMRQIGRATMKSPHVPATPLDDVLENLHRIRHGKEVEAWIPPHKTWFYPIEEHDEHVHVDPRTLPPVQAVDFNRLSDEEKDDVSTVVKHFLVDEEKNS
jgi:hypothetical protein